jgi:uncharacterized membrane protein YqgA involved in biofilm formation
MLIGPYANGLAIAVGGAFGALCASCLPERLRTALPLSFGAASIGMGVVFVSRVAHLPVMVISTIVGSAIGELVWLEHGIGRAGAATRGLIERFAPAREGLARDAFLETYVALIVLFCASATGVFGAINEGMTGDPAVLLTKAFLDLCTAAIFATTLGLPVAVLCIPQLLIQLALAYGGVVLMPFTTPAMIADFSAVGGVMLLATGLRICGIKLFPVANMLPGLVVALPISALWTRFF